MDDFKTASSQQPAASRASFSMRCVSLGIEFLHSVLRRAVWSQRAVSIDTRAPEDARMRYDGHGDARMQPPA